MLFRSLGLSGIDATGSQVYLGYPVFYGNVDVNTDPANFFGGFTVGANDGQTNAGVAVSSYNNTTPNAQKTANLYLNGGVPNNVGDDVAWQVKYGDGTLYGFRNTSLSGSLKVTGSTYFKELTGSLQTFSASVNSRLNSGGGGINTSSFATTGSNNFNGNQSINGAVSSSGVWVTGNSYRFNTSSGSNQYQFYTQLRRDGFDIYQYQNQPYAFNMTLSSDQLNAYSGSQFNMGLQTNGSGQSQFGGATYLA